MDFHSHDLETFISTGSVPLTSGSSLSSATADLADFDVALETTSTSESPGCDSYALWSPPHSLPESRCVAATAAAEELDTRDANMGGSCMIREIAPEGALVPEIPMERDRGRLGRRSWRTRHCEREDEGDDA